MNDLKRWLTDKNIGIIHLDAENTRTAIALELGEEIGQLVDPQDIPELRFSTRSTLKAPPIRFEGVPIHHLNGKTVVTLHPEAILNFIEQTGYASLIDSWIKQGLDPEIAEEEFIRRGAAHMQIALAGRIYPQSDPQKRSLFEHKVFQKMFQQNERM